MSDIRILPVRKGPAPPAPSTVQPWGPDHTPKREIGINEFDGGARPKAMHMPGPKPHFHANRLGILEACYHRCRPVLTWSFWLGLTAGFPLEHLLWEKAPLFSDITKWLGL